MSDKYLNAISKYTQIMGHVAAELHHLSKCLRAVGNIELSHALGMMSVELDECEKGINDAVGEELHVQCQRSQERVVEAFTIAMKSCGVLSDDTIEEVAE